MSIEFTRYIRKSPRFIERTRSEYCGFHIVHRYLRRYGGRLDHDTEYLLDLPIGYTFRARAIRPIELNLFTIPSAVDIPPQDWLTINPAPVFAPKDLSGFGNLIVGDQRPFHKVEIEGVQSAYVQPVDIGGIRPLWVAWTAWNGGWGSCGAHFQAQVAAQMIRYYWTWREQEDPTAFKAVQDTDKLLAERNVFPGYYGSVPQKAIENGRDAQKTRNDDAWQTYRNFFEHDFMPHAIDNHPIRVGILK